MVEDRAGDPLVAALWDAVEDWSSAAIQRTREAAATGPTDVLDAEIRMLIAHAAQLRGVIELHLEAVDLEPAVAKVAASPVARPAAPAPQKSSEAESTEVLALLHEAAHAQVCPECFTMVRLDEVETHDLVCVRHKTIEKMDRKLEEEPAPEPAPELEAEDVAESAPAPMPEPEAAAAEATPEAAPVADAEATPAAAPVADHVCNSADFERPLCATCGGLHWYCSICGAQRDDCRTNAATG